MSNFVLMNECPCGSGKTYELCCATAHDSLASVDTAEQLMRSRYSAFTLGDGDYLMASHHSSTRPSKEKKKIVSWANSVEWIELKILNKTMGAKKDEKGTVEFKAFYREYGELKYLHENSQFVRENRVWVYLGFAE